MKSQYIQYYVEGEDEEKLVNVLKSQLRVIKPGKIQKLNVVEREISDARLRTLSRGTMVVLVFDTDTGNTSVLEKNIKKLESCSSVSSVVIIPQVPNLEEELVKSCNIKTAPELIGCKSDKDFKRDFKRTTNLDAKLKGHGFDINRLWNSQPAPPYQNFINQSSKIKIIP